MKFLKWLPWLAMVIIAAGALAIGSVRHSTPTLDQRVLAIAGQFSCPVCQGETAAESNTPPSLEIRSFIRHSLQQGQTTSQIKSELVHDYGPGILEAPQTRGISLWVWVVPILVVLAAAGGLALAFSRWRGRLDRAPEPTDDDRDLVRQALGTD